MYRIHFRFALKSDILICLIFLLSNKFYSFNFCAKPLRNQKLLGLLECDIHELALKKLETFDEMEAEILV